jgi:diguanylate cyclase (GGDEF)-like protein
MAFRLNLRRISNSLVTRLLALSMLVLATGTVLTYRQITRFLREDLTQTVSAQQMALASYVARDIDQSLTDRLQFIERLALALPIDLLDDPDPLLPWLRAQHDLNPLFSRGLMVSDAQGRVITGHRPAAAPHEPSTRDTAEHSSALLSSGLLSPQLAGHAAIGRPQHGSAMPGEPTLPSLAPVKSRSGRVARVLIGTTGLSAPRFLDGSIQARIGGTGGILLMSPADKLYVASSIPAMVMQSTPAPGINALHDRAMAGFRGSGLTVNAQGVEELAAIASVPSTGWFVVARIPTSEALATVGRAQTYILQQRLPGMLLIVGLIGVLAARVLRPMVRAANQADKMTRGDIPLAPLPVEHHDEIGTLTAAFNRLLDKLQAHQTELALLAHHDALTGLPNRKLLADRLAQALVRAQRNGSQVAVLFLDLDGFKHINDSLGHEAGDQALKDIATRLLGVVRHSDTVARLGGDEFVVLAADFDEAGLDRIGVLAQKCIDAISKPLQTGAAQRILGVSIGIAWSDGSHSANDLLATADRAMYTVK